MKERSQRLLAAGWVLKKRSPDVWQAISPENQIFQWEDGVWHPGETQLLEELTKNETAIREGVYSSFVGTSRLTVPEADPQPGLLTRWLIQKNRIQDQSILRVRCGPDPAGDELLYAAGARRIKTLLPPWPAAPETHRHIPFHLLIGEHVADVLPKQDRASVLPRLISYLAPDTEAYFSFYQLDALPLHLPHRSENDGYVFTRGLHEVFIKPSLPGRCAPSLHSTLGGFTEELDILYNEIFCRWTPDA
jgi:hypothetical protein